MESVTCEVKKKSGEGPSVRDIASATERFVRFSWNSEQFYFAHKFAEQT